jgi:FkbM family methyltransferase
VDRFNGDNNSSPETNGEYIFLRNELPKLREGVVFDVGANVGSWTSCVLRLNPKVNVHCFEPSKATYEKLAQKEWPSNVWQNNIGLGEVEGAMELNVVDEESGLNSLYLRRGVDCAMAVKKEIISITTVDGYCEINSIQKIDLIKVDVEGHELAVFKGMSQMLSEGRIRVIQFEYGGCNLDSKVHLGDIWYFLEPYGFSFYKLYPEGPKYIERYQQSLESFKYSNWVVIHASHGPV